MNGPSRNVCVVGAGIIGSWTALHLAEAGVRTTLLEQFPLPHSRGSSHGASRAFRLLGDPELDRLDYSLDRWRSLEKESGEMLFLKTGLLNFGPPGDSDLEKFMAVLEQGGRPCEWLSSEDIAARYPSLRYPKAWGAAWDPNGGILFAHRCLNATQVQFRKLGGRIMTASVKSVEPAPGRGMQVTLHDPATGTPRTVEYDQVVLCAGPWTGKLLPELAGLLRCLLTPVTYWRDPSGIHSAAKGFPILFNARLTGIYGLPSCEYPGLVKILYHGGAQTDPDVRDMASTESYIEQVNRYVRDHLPLLDHERPAILESCMYTMTPDSDPIIDRAGPGIVVGGGFSGSGFKHAPATGKMLAALALGDEKNLPGGFNSWRYRLARFHTKTESGSV